MEIVGWNVSRSHNSCWGTWAHLGEGRVDQNEHRFCPLGVQLELSKLGQNFFFLHVLSFWKYRWWCITLNLQVYRPPLRSISTQSSGEGKKIEDFRIADFWTCSVAGILFVKFYLAAKSSSSPWIWHLDFTV